MIFQVLLRDPNLLSEIPYATLANYSPRGDSELSQKSRRICGGFKAGKEEVIKSAFPHLAAPKSAALRPFLNANVILVPAPRSAPLSEGALWPSKVIADLLVEAGFGKEVLPCIKRVKAVPKSSSSPANERPEVSIHYESLTVETTLLAPAYITLIDDVLTQGRTTMACAMRLQEAFPEAEIRVFAMIRTQGLKPNIDELVDPAIGIIKYYKDSGKTFRDP
jgi:hypothetical protein